MPSLRGQKPALHIIVLYIASGSPLQVNTSQRPYWEDIVNIITKLAIAAGLATALTSVAVAQDKLVVGFSQIGSESGWRAAETSVTKQQAADRGIDLKFADAQ